MSDDLQTRDKQNQEVDSSEQYAINIIGNRALQSADFVLKESKRTLEKTLAGKSAPQQFKRGRLWTSPSTPRQAPTAETVPPARGAHTPTEMSIWQEMKDKPISSESCHKYHAENHGTFLVWRTILPMSLCKFMWNQFLFRQRKGPCQINLLFHHLQKTKAILRRKKWRTVRTMLRPGPRKGITLGQSRMIRPICRQRTTICI